MAFGKCGGKFPSAAVCVILVAKTPDTTQVRTVAQAGGIVDCLSHVWKLDLATNQALQHGINAEWQVLHLKVFMFSKTFSNCYVI